MVQIYDVALKYCTICLSYLLVWNRISQSVGLSEAHPALADFNKVRYNTQADLNSRGESKTVLAKDYKHGHYAVSKFEPLSDQTRSILDRCWKDDCVYSSLVRHEFHSQHQCFIVRFL